MTNSSDKSPVSLPDAPLRGRHYWLMLVAQMEQTVVNVLTAAVGVMMPLMKMFYLQTSGAEPSTFMQGCVAASGLLGITLGAPILGAIGDRRGYLGVFRLSALLIFFGALGAWLIDGSLWWTILSLFIVGLGVGGGYSTDDVYLSELMPKKSRLRMIGLAKTIAATGGFWGGFAALGILKLFPFDTFWRYSMITIAALGLLAFVMRIRWWESPKWLLVNGQPQKALVAAQHFLGKNIVPAKQPSTPQQKVPFAQMFKGQTLWKVIATSIPWAMSGVGAYGMGTFLPIILMNLGIHTGGQGVVAVEHSVFLTSVINIFMAVGFVVGLLVLNRIYHIRLMAIGFVISGLAIFSVMAGHMFAWPVWVSVLAFIVYQIAECGGPGIITFVLPAEVFNLEERGTGSGIAASVGKMGAIFSVFVMPSIMKHWGIDGAMIFCGTAMFIGALITVISGRKALPRKSL